MWAFLAGTLLLVFAANLPSPVFSAIVVPTFTDDQKTEITNYVNYYRWRHGAGVLTWDDDIMNDIAQPWATSLATDTSVTMEHTGASSTPANNGEWGENLAWFQGYSNDVMDRMKDSVDAWYNEVNDMDWSNPEPTAYGGGAHTGVVGHFTCLVWVASTTQGMGYAYNDATLEINVNQNVQSTCNYVGSYADNVFQMPSCPPTQAPTSFTIAAAADRASSKSGAPIAAVILIILFLVLVWCQHPFLIDEMEKNPHNDAYTSENSAEQQQYTGWHDQPLWYWTEWCGIQWAATRDCFVWYFHASYGAETKCCKVLHAGDKGEGKNGSSKVDVEKTGESKQNGEEVKRQEPTALESCWASFTTCVALWCRATKACLCEFWLESNEEIDHHEERKEGHSWCSRLFASLTLCGTFYATTFVQTTIRLCTKTQICCAKMMEKKNTVEPQQEHKGIAP